MLLVILLPKTRHAPPHLPRMAVVCTVWVFHYTPAAIGLPSDEAVVFLRLCSSLWWLWPRPPLSTSLLPLLRSNCSARILHRTARAATSTVTNRTTAKRYASLNKRSCSFCFVQYRYLGIWYTCMNYLLPFFKKVHLFFLNASKQLHFCKI